MHLPLSQKTKGKQGIFVAKRTKQSSNNDDSTGIDKLLTNLQVPLPKNPSWFDVLGVEEDDIKDCCYRIVCLYDRKKVSHLSQRFHFIPILMANFKFMTLMSYIIGFSLITKSLRVKQMSYDERWKTTKNIVLLLHLLFTHRPIPVQLHERVRTCTKI